MLIAKGTCVKVSILLNRTAPIAITKIRPVEPIVSTTASQRTPQLKVR